MIHQKIKNLFMSSVEHVCFNISNYSVHPDIDFQRNRKISPQKLISFLVSQDSSSTKVEMLDFCGLDASSMPASSALNQQWQKLKPAALDISYIRLHKHLYHYNFWKADTQSVFLSCHKNQKFRFHLVYGTSA